jgi:Fic family protein
VRSDRAWEQWLAFFFEGVAESARGATETATSIHQLHEDERTRALSSGAGKYDVALVDVLFRRTLVNSSWVQQHLDVTSPTANKALERLCELGILREGDRQQTQPHLPI